MHKHIQMSVSLKILLIQSKMTNYNITIILIRFKIFNKIVIIIIVIIIIIISTTGLYPNPSQMVHKSATFTPTGTVQSVTLIHVPLQHTLHYQYITTVQYLVPEWQVVRTRSKYRTTQQSAFKNKHFINEQNFYALKFRGPLDKMVRRCG